jgi:hypothetical protein
MLYPEAEKQAEEGNPWFGFRFTFEVPDYSPDDEVKEILRDQPNVLRDQPAAESNLEESRRDHTAGVGVKFSDSYSDLGFGVTGSYQFPIGDNVSVGPFATVYGDNNFDFGGKLSVDVDDWRISGLAGSSVKDIKDRTENQGILGGSIGHKLGDLYLEIGANINGLRKAFGGDFKERVSPFATLSIPFGGSEEPSRYQPSNLMPSLNEFADEGDLNNVVFVEYDLDSNGKIDYHDKNLFVNAHRGHNQCQWDISSYGPGKVNSYDFFEGIIRDGHEGSLDRSVLDAKNQRFIEGFEDYKENIRPNLN